MKKEVKTVLTIKQSIMKLSEGQIELLKKAKLMSTHYFIVVCRKIAIANNTTTEEVEKQFIKN